MDLTIKIIEAFGYVIYAALALLAVWGVYNAILLYRSLAKKSIGQRGPILLEQVRELLKAGKSDAAAADLLEEDGAALSD